MASDPHKHGGSSSGAAASSSGPEASNGGNESGRRESHNDGDGMSFFDCSVCLEHATDPVVTQCGHLYCWSCLFRWIQAGKNTCPVCKAGVTTDNVIPIYGKGGSQSHPAVGTGGEESKDDTSVPQRPSGRRPEAPRFSDMGPNAAFFSGGMGYFPSLFGLHFQTYWGTPPVSPSSQHMNQMISRLFIVLGVLILLLIVLH
eukprot:gb/GECG01006248.1/.p1 GENE.gb/GECG01006248.1/~~gb/GECG01006248.1/.p1  ORF type:complete len:201 (+),score=22.47 gb/GECG01006248.1/:1-603(+)